MQNVATINLGPRMLRRMVKARVRKKILSSLLTIGLVATLIGVATFAYFSDTETSTRNIASAGTLDLKVDDEDDPNVGRKITLEDMAPCQRKEIGPITLTNAGTIDGIADLHIRNVKDFEDEPGCDANGLPASSEPEAVAEKALGNDVYDISKYITVDVWYDADKDGVKDEGEVIIAPKEDMKLSKLECVHIDLGDLPAGDSADLYLGFHLQKEGKNEYQGDYSTFDIEFTLHQPGI